MKYKPTRENKKSSGRKIVQAGGEYVRAKKPPERKEEIHVLRPLVKVLYDLESYTKALTFFHIPNELLRRSVMKRIFYHLGVRAGVPDLVILLRGNQQGASGGVLPAGLHGAAGGGGVSVNDGSQGKAIFIELKYGKPGKGEKGLSEGQEGFIAWLKKLGFPVYIICAQDGRESVRQLYEILRAHGVKV